MILHALEMRRISLDLVTPFRTSFGEQTSRDILLLKLTTDAGEGWGECVAMTTPVYSPEYADGVEHVLTHHIWPSLVAAGQITAADIAPRLAHIKGHPMAKAALESAALDAELRAAGSSFHEMLGAPKDRVPSGVSVGIFDDLDVLLEQVQGYVDAGYARIKLKIEPGRDLVPVARVRELIGPDMGLQVDANTAYTRDDIDHLCKLDEYDLLLNEQPLAEEDIVGHAMLAKVSNTPVCLDESVVSAATAADAVELGAADIINIKPGRVGGYLEAVKIHDWCYERGVPVWCGGMVETGIGRAANAALASLPGFTLPGDISAAARFYTRDIVIDPIDVDNGEVAVPSARGMGFDLDLDFLDSITTATTTLTA